MEVGYISNTPLSLGSPDQAEHNISDIMETGAHYEVNKDQFSYEKVMMGPDELKTFFYMLIGANDLQVVSDGEMTGSLVDQFV